MHYSYNILSFQAVELLRTTNFFASFWTEPKPRSMNFPKKKKKRKKRELLLRKEKKKDETNIFPIWNEQSSSIRFLFYRFSIIAFKPCVKLVYVLVDDKIPHSQMWSKSPT